MLLKTALSFAKMASDNVSCPARVSCGPKRAHIDHQHINDGCDLVFNLLQPLFSALQSPPFYKGLGNF